MVSFGGMENELLDDIMSLAASDAEEMSGSTIDPAKPGMDGKLFCVFSKAVEELGLEWSAPE